MGISVFSKGDLLVIKAEPESLSQAISVLGLRLVDNVKPPSKDDEDEDGEKPEVRLVAHEEFDLPPPWV